MKQRNPEGERRTAAPPKRTRWKSGTILKGRGGGKPHTPRKKEKAAAPRRSQETKHHPKKAAPPPPLGCCLRALFSLDGGAFTTSFGCGAAVPPSSFGCGAAFLPWVVLLLPRRLGWCVLPLLLRGCFLLLGGCCLLISLFCGDAQQNNDVYRCCLSCF